MVRYSIIICIAAVGIYCFQKYQKWRYRNPVLRSKDDYVIEWHDKNLEKAIREQTGLTDGEIRLSDLWEYRYWYLSNKGIKSVEDLRDLKNIVLILLNDNEY